MEETAVSHDVEEFANVEQLRMRQSECVNLKALELEQRLQEWRTNTGNSNNYNVAEYNDINTSNKQVKSLEASLLEASDNCSEFQRILHSLPPQLIDVLLLYIHNSERAINDNKTEVTRYEQEITQYDEQLSDLIEKTSKLKDSVTFLSDKSSAELQEFRSHLAQCANWAKERNRELADLNRQQEKTEFEIRRTDMELERLRNLAKRVK